jgi:hypothetical protein
MSKHILFGIALAVLLLSGCTSSPDVQLVELSKNTVVYDEIVRINNCGGKGDSEQTKSRDFATTVEFGAGVSAGYQSIVQGSLSAKYSEYRNTSVSQRLVAPPGTNMEFVLRWSDDVRAGNVQVNGKSGTYEVRIPVSVEQISSRDLGCGISVPTQQPTLTSGTQASRQVDYQQTGGGVRVTYSVNLGEREIITGHADKFQGVTGCVAFLIMGPGKFNFWVESGIWYKWENTTSSLSETLLQEQVDILVNKYNCNRSNVKIVRLP